MLKTRVIPCLLLKDWGIEKSIQFKDFVYVGSPINAARVFNAHHVDELILLDIKATLERRGPIKDIIAEIAEETCMPLTVGGGIRSLDQAWELLKAGADRIAINSYAVERPEIFREGAERFGRQCMVASIDARRRANGTYEVYTHGGRRPTGRDPLDLALELEDQGAGEILLNSIDRDGTMAGYDIELIRRVADRLAIPLIALGGAGSVQHLAEAVELGHASAVAAGAFFLFYGKRRTVLITYPSDPQLASALGSQRVRWKRNEVSVGD
jgi:cyclase